MSKSGRERIIRVRWLLNPNEPPLDNVELVEQNGVVLEIRQLKTGAAHVLPITLLPPLVNSHTHLEFSTLSEPIRPALPFPDWISAVIQYRRDDTNSTSDSIQRGLAESLQNGIAAIGEITTTQTINPNDVPDGCNVISFREIIGLQKARIPELMNLATMHLTAPTRQSSKNRIINGISPHAPYTVHPELFESLIDLAGKHNVVVAMHLAETKDELDLLQNGRGRFVDFLTRLGLWDSDIFPGGRDVREFLEQLVRVPRALAIHGNYYSADNIRFLANHRSIATIYCPRTHAFFGHDTYPIRQLLSAGARVILGTDSRASTPDLRIWSEFQFVARYFSDIPIPQLLAMVTTDAADALGLPVGVFRIRSGSPLRCVVLNSNNGSGDLRQTLCDSSTQPSAMLAENRIIDLATGRR